MLKECLVCVPSGEARSAIVRGIRVLLRHIGWEHEPLEEQADKYLQEVKDGKRDVYADLNGLIKFYGGGRLVIAGSVHANSVARWLRFENVSVSVGVKGATPIRSYKHHSTRSAFTPIHYSESVPMKPVPTNRCPEWVIKKNVENMSYMAEDECVNFYYTGKLKLDSPERRYAKRLGYIKMEYGRAQTFTIAGLEWIENVLRQRGLPLEGGKWRKIAEKTIEKAQHEKSRAGKKGGNKIRTLIENIDHAAEEAMLYYYHTGEFQTDNDHRFAWKTGYYRRYGGQFNGLTPEGIKWIEDYIRSKGEIPDGGRWRQVVEDKIKSFRVRMKKQPRARRIDKEKNEIFVVEAVEYVSESMGDDL